MAYFVPSIHNGIWQERVAPFYENFVVNQFYTPFLGFLTLLLSLVGIFRRWRHTWIWFLLALLYIILALGPELAINGHTYPAIPMPYRLVEDFFLLRLIRRPDRFNIFLSLPLAMLAGWGVQAILQRISNRNVRWLVISASALLILLAYNAVPFATTAPETPQWLAQLGRKEEVFGILDIPINDRSYDKWYMQYQTDHGLPIATGHVSRLPRESTAFLDSVPFLMNLKQNDQIPDPSLSDVGRQLNLLTDAGIKYLIVHKKFANEGLQAIWRDWLVISPIYEDDELLVYNTSPKAGRDFEFIHDLSGDIGLVKTKYAPAEGIQGGVIKVESVWGTTATPQQDLDSCLELVDSQKRSATRVCQAPDAQVQTSNWPANDLRRASYIMPIPINIDPGNYELVLDLTDPASGEQVGETAVLGPIVIHPFMPEYETAVSWQKGIRLLGLDMQENDENLDIKFYWQAEQSLENSYKTFLHFQNLNSGNIEVQSDTIPRNWTYPTTDWEAGEIVRDVIRVPLDGLPQGSYSIVIGLYDESSGERLPLSTPAKGRVDSYELTTWEH
jgi:hypothetical protein